MPNINQVALSGRIVQTPVRSTSEKGTRFSARIAASRSYRDDQDHWQEDVSFFDIIVQGKLAEHFAERLSKGTPVFITGRLKSRPNSEVNGVKIDVRNLQILESDPGND